MHNEINISSCIVHIVPNKTSSIVGKIAALEGVEIAVIEQSHGKIIIVIETTTTEETSHIINTISGYPGVLSVAMVYHHTEKAASLTASI